MNSSMPSNNNISVESVSKNDLKAIDLSALFYAWNDFLSKTDFSNPYDSRRIFHGRGGYFPGLEWCCIDVFAPVLLITLFKAPPNNILAEMLNKLKPDLASAQLTSVAIQHRYLAKSPIEFVVGQSSEPVFALRKGLRYHLNFNRQNLGFFLDIEPGRRWLEENANGKNVLNLFAYTCAFSVVAKSVGARAVVNIDMSSPALNIGRENHRCNDIDTSDVNFLALDIFKSWSRIKKFAPYDIIIIDPPSYQKGSFIAAIDYGKLIRKISLLAKPGTQILACLNSPELDVDFLKGEFSKHEDNCKLIERLQASQDFPDSKRESSLKMLCYEYQAKT